MWLVRYNEQLGKLNRVGLDIVTSLPDVAGRQALNLAESRPTFAAERTQNQSASSAQWDILEEVVDTEDEDNNGSDTIDPGDLQGHVRDELEVLATCIDNGENDAPIPGVDNSQLETACLKLAELPEALAIVQAARRGASDQNRHYRASPGGKGKTRQLCGRQRVPNSARDQRQNDDRPAQVVGRAQRARPQLNSAEARICKQSWTSERHAAFVTRVARPDTGQETLNAKVVLSM